MAFIAIHWHCTCGKEVKAQLRKGPVLDRARAAWAQLHTGPGHEPRPDVFARAVDASIAEIEALMVAAGVVRT